MSSDLIYHVISSYKLGYNSQIRVLHLRLSPSSYSSSSSFFIRDLMDPVIIVSGNWVKKHRYVFNADGRGCRVVHINEKTKLDELAKIVLDDYGLKESSHQIQLSYMFSNKTLKTMAHDTPPVYLSNTRQLQVFLSLRKIEHLRLCLEITENETSRNDGAREKNKRLFSYSSQVESRYEDYCGSYDGFNLEDEVEEKDEEDEVEEENEVFEENEVLTEENEVDEEDEEDDEFDSRFDMFDHSDGDSSEDDNFSLFGESPTQDEDSPTLPPKKRPHNLSTEVPRLDLSSLNLSVGQRFESKADLEKRLKLLTVKDRFDFDVHVSDSDTLVVKCWVGGCLWRVRATTLGDPPAFYVRIYDSDHTCSITERSSRSRKATAAILGELYKDFLGDVGPSVRPRSVGISINKKFGVKVIISTLRLT